MTTRNTSDHRRITINRNANQPYADRQPANPSSGETHDRATSETTSADSNSESDLLAGFNKAAQLSTDFDGLLRNIANELARAECCPAIWLITGKTDSDRTASPAIEASIDSVVSLFGSESDAVWHVYCDQAVKMIGASWQSGSLVNEAVACASNAQLCAMPLNLDGKPGCVIGVFDQHPLSSTLSSTLGPSFVISHVARCIAAWIAGTALNNAHSNIELLNEVNKQLLSLGKSSSRTEALMAFVNSMRTLTGVSQVSLALHNGKSKTKLVAISDVESFDPGSKHCQAMQSLMAETIKVGKTITYSTVNEPSANEAAELPGDAEARRLAAEFCRQAETGNCVCVCLTEPDSGTGEDQVVGAVLLNGDPKSFDSELKIHRIEQLTLHVGRQLSIVLRSFRSTRERINTKVVEAWRQRATKIMVAIVAIITITLCIPRPLAISSKSEMQPVLRRFVAAPHDGILQSALVETGEIVQQGQVLAELDGRQLRIERSSRRAEYNSQRKQRDAALAVRDVSGSQIASLEMQRLQAEIDLLNRRLGNLEITSPISGMVISGDLEKAQGAPLKIGQNLFEISPLDELLAEVAIPEAEIQYVREEMTVMIKLDAYPFQTWEGVIEKISPQAELINNESAFVATVRFENELGKLKPGMKGSASIRSDQYPLAWHIVRKPWEQVRRLFLW